MLQGSGATEYGLLGAALLAMLGALIWHMRTVTRQLVQLVENNTVALTELRASLRGTITMCPFVEREGQAAAGLAGGPRRAHVTSAGPD